MGKKVSELDEVLEAIDDDDLVLRHGSETVRIKAKNLFGSQPSGVVNAVYFGLESGGSFSDAVNSIMASVPGEVTIEINAGDYIMDDTIVLRSGVSIVGRAGAIVRRFGDYRFNGNSGTITSLVAASDVLAGGRRVALDAASYAAVEVGDYIRVTDPSTPVNVDFVQDFVAADLSVLTNWVYQSQQVKIVAKIGSNTVRVDQAFHVPFAITTTGKIELVEGVIENVAVEGIEFVNDPTATIASSEGVFFNISNIYDLSFRKCKFNLNGLSGGIFARFCRILAIGCDFSGTRNLSIFFRQACPNSRVVGCSFLDQETNDAAIFVEAHNYNIAITGNTFDGSNFDYDAGTLIGGVQMDCRVHGVSVTGNMFNGLGFGVRMELGCIGNVIKGNTFSNIAINAIRIAQGYHNVIDGNTFLNCCDITVSGSLSAHRNTIQISSGSENIITNNNSLSQGPNAANFINGAGTNALIENNVIKGTTAKIVCNSQRTTIRGNRIITSTPVAIDINGSTQHYNIIENNYIETTYVGGSTKSGILLTQSECNWIHKNEFVGFTYKIQLSSGTYLAQSIFQNYGGGVVCNFAITAPVMPTFATMPRGFVIYKIQTGTIDALHGVRWEYTTYVGGTGNRFNVHTTTVTTLDLA